MERLGLDCRVAMLTAVEPEFAVIEMGCDDYVVKPVTRAQVRDAVSRLLSIVEYNDRMRELPSKRLQRNVLEVEKRPGELEASEEFQTLEAEIAALESEIEGIAEKPGSEYLKREL